MKGNAMQDKLRIMLIEARVRVKVLEELLGEPHDNTLPSGGGLPVAPVHSAPEQGPDLLTQFRNGGGAAALQPMGQPAKVPTTNEPEGAIRVIGAQAVTYEAPGEVMA